MQIIIIGGGIIGVSTAYYLAKRGISCTIIEKTHVACAASGKAGGFLAKNWCDSYEVGPLARESFDMHMNFADGELDNICDYRRVTTLSVQVDCVKNQKKPVDGAAWVSGPVCRSSTMETPTNSAQVHPYKLTHTLLAKAQSLTQGGTRVLIGSVAEVLLSSDTEEPKVTGVKLESGQEVAADCVLVAMGPWSADAVKWFPKNSLPLIGGHRAHSIIMQPSATAPNLPGAECLFLQFRSAHCEDSPEIYPRPDGTVYMCGLGDDTDLPESAEKIKVEKWRCSKLRDMAYATSSCLEDGELICEQACFLPISPDGVPIMGKVPGVTGAYIASGHSCWGILNAPGTGRAMAELILDGKCSFLDLDPFDPARFKK